MAGLYGSVGTDYRELQGPAQVNTDLPDNGAAARAAALGSLFREFEGVSSDIGQKAQLQAGALAGAASGNTGDPQYKQGLARITAYGQAFNNAATGAYAIEAEAQADDAAARLRVQANNNPATFQATYAAVRDGVLKAAPPDAVPMLTELYNKRLAAGLAAVSGDQAAEQKQTQKQIYDEGVARQTSKVANLQGSASPNDQLEAQDEHVKLSLLIQGGVNAGLYSEAEGRALNVNAMRQITGQVFSTQVDRELWNPQGNVLALIDRFTKAHQDNLSNPNEAPVLSEPEYQKLMSDAFTKVREFKITQSMLHQEGKTEEQLRFEKGDQEYTTMLLSGKLTESALARGVASGDVKPETARALHSQLLNANLQPKSDEKMLLRVQTDPNFLDMKLPDLLAVPGVNDQDKLKLYDQIQKRNAGWEGTQAVKDAKGAISNALKIPPGTNMASLNDDQKKALGDAMQEFIGLGQSTDPSKRDSLAATNAQTVIKHAQQREAQGQIEGITSAKQSAVRNHGPGTADEWSPEKMKGYQKQQDDAIATLRQQLGGQ